MNHTEYIGVVGHKKSGKTTLIENLVREMTLRGQTVGTIKMTVHDLEFDSPGKDTHRHRAAGAKQTLIKSKSEMALFTRLDFFDDEMIKSVFRKCDFVFIEGDNDPKNPKIYVADKKEIRPDITGVIVAVWGEERKEIRAGHFAEDQISELCDFLINRYKKQAVNMKKELKIELNVNGKEIEMNEFVKRITGNLIYAVLESLRLDEDPKTAIFKLRVG
jgi:molybdopterin-guanine dinucleotide biosynthesis protein B